MHKRRKQIKCLNLKNKNKKEIKLLILTDFIISIKFDYAVQ